MVCQESNSGNLSLESVPLTCVLKCLPRAGKDSMECPEDSQMRHPSKVMDKPEEAEEAIAGGKHHTRRSRDRNLKMT